VPGAPATDAAAEGAEGRERLRERLQGQALDCLRQAEEGLFKAKTVEVDSHLCVGLAEDAIVDLHIEAELCRCAPWPHHTSRQRLGLSGAGGPLPRTRCFRVLRRG
jgi:hypothetical protein